MPAISEEWLGSVGFKYREPDERQQWKHWTLTFSEPDDYGLYLETTAPGWLNRNGEHINADGGWFLWIGRGTQHIHTSLRMSETPRTTLSDGTQVYPEHRRLKENGQQEGYVVLADEERAKGFVRPVRRTYTHETCGTDTTMGQTIAETYARNPFFYAGTFCCACGGHFPVGEDGQFVWKGTNEKVGT